MNVRRNNILASMSKLSKLNGLNEPCCYRYTPIPYSLRDRSTSQTKGITLSVPLCVGQGSSYRVDGFMVHIFPLSTNDFNGRKRSSVRLTHLGAREDTR